MKKSAAKFFIDKDGTKTETTLRNGYFLSGYNNEPKKGTLYAPYFGEHGTTLTPVLKSDGTEIKMIEFAGKDVSEIGEDLVLELIENQN